MLLSCYVCCTSARNNLCGCGMLVGISAFSNPTPLSACDIYMYLGNGLSYINLHFTCLTQGSFISSYTITSELVDFIITSGTILAGCRVTLVCFWNQQKYCFLCVVQLDECWQNTGRRNMLHPKILSASNTCTHSITNHKYVWCTISKSCWH